jgi:hypothetical protein
MWHMNKCQGSGFSFFAGAGVNHCGGEFFRGFAEAELPPGPRDRGAGNGPGSENSGMAPTSPSVVLVWYIKFTMQNLLTKGH